MPRTNLKYGWRRDTPDFRDLSYAVEPTAFEALPPSVDLRPECPPVWDQGNIGSCTAHSVGFVYTFDVKKQDKGDFMPSRLFIYYNERLVEGTVASDAGAQIRDGIKSIAVQGVSNETIWPYEVTRFAMRPPIAAYQDAVQHKAVKYMRVAQDEQNIKACLAEGYPIAFGFTVYSEFESPTVAQTGVVPMPIENDECLGGHAVAIVGYDDVARLFLVRNSWGPGWGQSGYFQMPYDYVTNPNLASDFWTVRVVTG